jgi:hypothetical protein
VVKSPNRRRTDIDYVDAHARARLHLIAEIASGLRHLSPARRTVEFEALT